MLKTLKAQAWTLFGFVALLWALEIADQLILGQRLDYLGIYPRQASGLIGVLACPFLHGGFYHLIANTMPFLVLGWLIMVRSRDDFWGVVIICTVLGGLGTWLFGRPAYHIGASGVIFGFFGYLLMRGWFERKPLSILFSLVVGWMYGWMVFLMLPTAPWISWEGHLFGFLSGALCAKWVAEANRKRAALKKG